MSAVGIYRSATWWQRRFHHRLRFALPLVGVAAVVGSIAGFTWALQDVFR